MSPISAETASLAAAGPVQCCCQGRHGSGAEVPCCSSVCCEPCRFVPSGKQARDGTFAGLAMQRALQLSRELWIDPIAALPRPFNFDNSILHGCTAFMAQHAHGCHMCTVLAQIGWAKHGLTQSAQNLFRYRPPEVNLNPTSD